MVYHMASKWHLPHKTHERQNICSYVSLVTYGTGLHLSELHCKNWWVLCTWSNWLWCFLWKRCCLSASVTFIWPNSTSFSSAAKSYAVYWRPQHLAVCTDICHTIQLLWYTMHSIQTGHIGMSDKTANIFFKDCTLYGNLASMGDLGSDICVGLLQTVTFSA